MERRPPDPPPPPVALAPPPPVSMAVSFRNQLKIKINQGQMGIETHAKFSATERSKGPVLSYPHGAPLRLSEKRVVAGELVEKIYSG